MFKIPVTQHCCLLPKTKPNISNVFHLSVCVRFYNQYPVSVGVCTLTIETNLYVITYHFLNRSLTRHPKWWDTANLTSPQNFQRTVWLYPATGFQNFPFLLLPLLSILFHFFFHFSMFSLFVYLILMWSIALLSPISKLPDPYFWLTDKASIPCPLWENEWPWAPCPCKSYLNICIRNQVPTARTKASLRTHANKIGGAILLDVLREIVRSSGMLWYTFCNLCCKFMQLD